MFRRYSDKCGWPGSYPGHTGCDDPGCDDSCRDSGHDANHDADGVGHGDNSTGRRIYTDASWSQHDTASGGDDTGGSGRRCSSSASDDDADHWHDDCAHSGQVGDGRVRNHHEVRW
jgi:hypothetical protein